jgi:hypothetical protein
MKNYLLNTGLQFIIVMIVMVNCSVKKDIVLLDEELSKGKIIIIGTVEFDYSQLSDKKIKGIDLFLESEEVSKNFYLSEKYFPIKSFKNYQFIAKVGKKGDYQLNYQQNMSSSETENLVSLMDMDRNMQASTKHTLQKYTLNDCKIINIGKIVVCYTGGNVIDGKISYSYSFNSFGGDTLALHAFKESYPLVYESCQNDICSFKSEFEACMDYIFGHISEDKKRVIKKFIEDHPDKLKSFFKDLTSENKQEYVEQIENYTFEQLKDVLGEIK